MEKLNIKLSLIRDVKVPNRGTSRSAGIDFYIPNDCDTCLAIRAGESIVIPSGVVASIPKGYMFVAFNKSGIATKKNLILGACVCDEDYMGEIFLHLINIGNDTQTLIKGDKIVQLILVPVLYAEVEIVKRDKLFYSTTERGEGAFGSTGL